MTLSGAPAVKAALAALATPERAKASAWFFKTGPGQYGEGDQFIGVSVPQQRTVVRQFEKLAFQDIEKLLVSPIHEHRLTATLILVRQFGQAKKDSAQQLKIVEFYLQHLHGINNWDIVDSSASYILGDYYLARPEQNAEWQKLLRKLVRSPVVWERRVAVLAAGAFIRVGIFDDTLELAELLVADKHDLIHKAVGWMLREVGKKDEKVLRQFLDKHASVMPRTMLRYAIERFSKSDREHYLFFKGL
ncbi:MAG: DNA alkylation repair protein [Patescibacteria group bacterium]